MKPALSIQAQYKIATLGSIEAYVEYLEDKLSEAVQAERERNASLCDEMYSHPPAEISTAIRALKDDTEETKV